MRPSNEEGRPLEADGLLMIPSPLRRHENHPDNTSCAIGCQEPCDWPTSSTSLTDELSSLVGALVSAELVGVLP